MAEEVARTVCGGRRDQQLDVKRLREFVAKAGSAELPALDHFERFRRRSRRRGPD